MSNPLLSLLDIDYPLIQAPMAGVSTPALAAAVSNAGALGSLGLGASTVAQDNLHWCGKDRAWLERTAQANTLLPQEILLLVGNETEDYFLLKKERRATVHEGRK